MTRKGPGSLDDDRMSGELGDCERKTRVSRQSVKAYVTTSLLGVDLSNKSVS